MQDSVGDEPASYVAERLRQALAHDGRVGELDVQVEVVGSRVVLSGEVATPERVEAVSEVAAEVLPDYEVDNQVAVTPVSEPPDVEKIR